MPEVSFVMVSDERAEPTLLSILRDSGHSNIAEPFDEEERRLPTEDRLVVVRGLLGAYPNALFAVASAELMQFVDAVHQLDGNASYTALRERFGIRRSDPRFWTFSDELHRLHIERAPVEHGLLDYSRLDAN